jgi:hypothetical protein
MRPQHGLFAVAAMWIAACGGAVAPADMGDSGVSGGSSGAVGGPASGGGGSSAGPPMSGQNAPSASPGTSGVAGADAEAPPTMPTPITDAAAPAAHRDAAVVRCNNSGPGGGGGGGGGGSGGPGSCSAFANETCSGVSYSVSCACPQGTCACQGPSSSFVAFSGCPSCPTSPQELFAVCGFPQ